MKTFGKVLFVFGIIQFIIFFWLGSTYFINQFSIMGMMSLSVALSIALAEKKIWLHAIITFAIVGGCILSYLIGFPWCFRGLLVVYVGYTLVLVFMKVRKIKRKAKNIVFD